MRECVRERDRERERERRETRNEKRETRKLLLFSLQHFPGVIIMLNKLANELL